MRIQHNIMAMNAYRNYNNNTSALSSNLEKLSSGYKINRAGDDAAGLAISEKMRAQISGLEQASSNVKDGISLVKTGEGAMQEIQDMLNRMTTLATQSANGTYDNDTDRAQLQKEVDNLKSEIDRIADSTNFNGISLLDGSLSGKSQVKALNIDKTYAIAGKYATASTGVSFGSTIAFNSLTQDDIGRTMDYTVTWETGDGVKKTTTVTLTYKGQGDGTQAAFTSSAKNNNYFEDSLGNRYDLNKSDGVLLQSLGTILTTNLKTDAEFTAAFDVTADSNAGLVLEATEKGSAGAKMLGVSITAKFKTEAVNSAVKTGLTAVCGTAYESVAAKDAYQKFAVTDLKIAVNGDDANTIDTKTFEIDGHKFLVVAASMSADAIKKLDSDVTVIKAAGSTINASSDAANIAAQITQVTGMATKVADATETAANILQYDIMFTEDTLKLSGNELSLQIGDTSDSYNQMGVVIDDMHTASLGIADLDISDQDGAAEAINKIKAAINQVSSTRGTLGATQNRLEHTQNNLSVMTENIQDAESTIRDTDIAEEMMSYTKNNILVQSAQAMLAQANSVPQGVLQLLQ
jgi:flagellin